MEYRVVEGDARDPSSYRRALASERAHLLLCDPPYCLLTRRRKEGDPRDPRRGVKIDREPVLRFETVREYGAFTEDWLPVAAEHLLSEAPIAIWTNFLGRDPILGTARALGWSHLVGEFVWAKRARASAGNEETLRVYETALVFTKRPPEPPAPDAGSRAWAVVAGYDDDGEAARWGGHPNHKPIGVLEPLTRDLSRPGDLVLDPFGGSGSIAAAAIRLGRRAATIEIEPQWASRIEERLTTLAASRA